MAGNNTSSFISDIERDSPNGESLFNEQEKRLMIERFGIDTAAQYFLFAALDQFFIRDKRNKENVTEYIQDRDKLFSCNPLQGFERKRMDQKIFELIEQKIKTFKGEKIRILEYASGRSLPYGDSKNTDYGAPWLSRKLKLLYGDQIEMTVTDVVPDSTFDDMMLWGIRKKGKEKENGQKYIGFEPGWNVRKSKFRNDFSSLYKNFLRYYPTSYWTVERMNQVLYRDDKDLLRFVSVPEYFLQLFIRFFMKEQEKKENFEQSFSGDHFLEKAYRHEDLFGEYENFFMLPGGLFPAFENLVFGIDHIYGNQHFHRTQDFQKFGIFDLIFARNINPADLCFYPNDKGLSYFSSREFIPLLRPDGLSLLDFGGAYVQMSDTRGNTTHF